MSERVAETRLARVLLRGATAGGAFAALVAPLFTVVPLFMGGGPVHGVVVAQMILVSLAIAVLAGLTASVELLSGRWPPSPRRDLGLGCLAIAVAFLVFVACRLQLSYAFGVVEKGSLTAAAQDVRVLLEMIGEDPLGFAVSTGALALVFGPLVFTRIRGDGLARQTLVTLAVSVAVAGPPLILIARERSHRFLFGNEGTFVLLIVVVFAASLPALSRGADKLEAKVARLLGQA